VCPYWKNQLANSILVETFAAVSCIEYRHRHIYFFAFAFNPSPASPQPEQPARAKQQHWPFQLFDKTWWRPQFMGGFRWRRIAGHSLGSSLSL
jgi:hypothetical protein